MASPSPPTGLKKFRNDVVSPHTGISKSRSVARQQGETMKKKHLSSYSKSEMSTRTPETSSRLPDWTRQEQLTQNVGREVKDTTGIRRLPVTSASKKAKRSPF